MTVRSGRNFGPKKAPSPGHLPFSRSVNVNSEHFQTTPAQGFYSLRSCCAAALRCCSLLKLLLPPLLLLLLLSNSPPRNPSPPPAPPRHAPPRPAPPRPRPAAAAAASKSDCTQARSNFEGQSQACEALSADLGAPYSQLTTAS